MADRDYYEVLGIPRDADSDQIIKAWRQARKLHPDRGGDAAKFKEAKEAYEVLSDPVRRAAYDITGEDESAELVRAALEVFTAHVAEWIDRDSPDPLQYARVEMHSNIRTLTAGNAAHSRRLGRLRRLVGRMVNRNRNEESLVEKILAKKIADLEATIVEGERSIKVTEMAIELVDQHEFLPEGTGAALGFEPLKVSVVSPQLP